MDNTFANQRIHLRDRAMLLILELLNSLADMQGENSVSFTVTPVEQLDEPQQFVSFAGLDRSVYDLSDLTYVLYDGGTVVDSSGGLVEAEDLDRIEPGTVWHTLTSVGRVDLEAIALYYDTLTNDADTPELPEHRPCPEALALVRELLINTASTLDLWTTQQRLYQAGAERHDFMQLCLELFTELRAAMEAAPLPAVEHASGASETRCCLEPCALSCKSVLGFVVLQDERPSAPRTKASPASQVRRVDARKRTSKPLAMRTPKHVVSMKR